MAEEAQKQELKRVIAEWVLTNGRLPDFENKVRASRETWDKVGKGGTIVYRGQGGKIPNESGKLPAELAVGIRPVLATSTSPGSVLPYVGPDCCIFRIKLEEGTRIVNVTDKVTFLNEKNEMTLGIKKGILTDIAKHCTPENWTGQWPTEHTPYPPLKEEILARCYGRDKYGKDGELKSSIPPENEVMVYFLDGTVSDPVPAEDRINKKKVYDVTYTPPPPSGGRRSSRGRTFRRTSKRRNKNGRRSTRKSKHHVRDRNA